MNEQNKETQDVESAVDVLEKSWEDAKSSVLALLGENVELEKSEKESQDEIEKSDDGDADDKGKMEYNEEDDDEDDEEEVSKSIEKSLEDSDDDTSVAMDAEPFLRDLVKGIDERFDAVNKSITDVMKAIGNTTELQKGTARMLAAYGDLTKSTAQTVEAIGNTPIPSGSVISARGTKFEKASSDGTGEGMSKEVILAKALKLAGDGKISGRDLTKLEGRVNRGQPIPESIQALLKEEA